MTTIDGIPVYRVLVDDEKDGMVRISLVDDPAVMSDFVSFDRQQRAQRFAVQDEEKRIVRGVVARADFPIFRTDAKMGDHYVIFPADSIRELAEKYLTEDRADRVDLMHDGEEQDGVHLVQWFIKDSAAGIAPEGFDDIADGSLFAEYHVTSDEIWEAVKDGTYKGFSMEVFYTLQPEEDAGYVREAVEDADGMFERIMQALSQRNNMKISQRNNLLRKLGRILSSFASVTTDKGVLAWDGDEDLKAGDRVYTEAEDGNRSDAPDGEYRTEDGKVITVVDGVVASITDDEAEVADEPEGLSRHNRIRAIFEESFQEKERAIYDALAELGLEYPYIVEAADTYAVICVYSDGEHYYRYGLSFDADGKCTLADSQEVKPAFVPLDFVSPFEDGAADPAAEVEDLRKENADLKAQIAKLSRTPLTDPAKKVTVTGGAEPGKTGIKGLDTLARFRKR